VTRGVGAALEVSLTRTVLEASEEWGCEWSVEKIRTAEAKMTKGKMIAGHIRK
jgi:hypothetical protein